LAFSDLAKRKFAEIGALELFTRLLSDKREISIHAAGTLCNVFLLPEMKQNLDDSLLLAIFRLLSSNLNSYHQKVVLQTLTSIVYNDERCAEAVYRHPQFSLLRDIETTGADKVVRNQLGQLFSALYAQVTREDGDKAGLHALNIEVRLVYYRPRFLGYKIV